MHLLKSGVGHNMMEYAQHLKILCSLKLESYNLESGNEL